MDDVMDSSAGVTDADIAGTPYSRPIVVLALALAHSPPATRHSTSAMPESAHCTQSSIPDGHRFA